MRKLPIKKSMNLKISKHKENPAFQQTSERARRLAEAMLISMEAGLLGKDPPEEWGRLFGTKDSAVVNLQKLVQVIRLLSNPADTTVDADEPMPKNTLSSEEMELLTEWLAGAGNETV